MIDKYVIKLIIFQKKIKRFTKLIGRLLNQAVSIFKLQIQTQTLTLEFIIEKQTKVVENTSI